jgi:hypothetical protein
MRFQPVHLMALLALALVGGAGGACTRTFINQRPVQTGDALPRPDVELALLDGAGQRSFPPEASFTGRLVERGNQGCTLSGAGVCRFTLRFSVEALEGLPEGAADAGAVRAELVFSMTYDDLPKLITNTTYRLSYSLLRAQKAMPTLNLAIRDVDWKLLWQVYSGDSVPVLELAGLTLRKAGAAKYYTDNQYDQRCRVKLTHNFTKVNLGTQELGIWVPGESRPVDLDGRRMLVRVLDHSTVGGGSCDDLILQEQAHLSVVLYQ